MRIAGVVDERERWLAAVEYSIQNHWSSGPKVPTENEPQDTIVRLAISDLET